MKCRTELKKARAFVEKVMRFGHKNAQKSTKKVNGGRFTVHG